MKFQIRRSLWRLMNTFRGLFRKPAPPVKVHHQAPVPEPDVEVQEVEPAPPVKVQLPAPEPDVEVQEVEPAPPIKVQLPAPEPDVEVQEVEPAPPIKVQLPAPEPDVGVHEVEQVQGPNVVHVAVDLQQPDQPKPKFGSSIFKFHQPSFREEDFELLVKRNKVSLEFCLWNEDSISGFVSVANLGFQKAVFVRATSNQWETWEDIPAEFLSSDAELERDRFTFSIPFETQVEFAIAYTVQGMTLWDNNEGNNYFITVT